VAPPPADTPVVAKTIASSKNNKKKAKAWSAVNTVYDYSWTGFL
jgi:hypothetical protein